MEIVWEGGDEEDEELDSTLQMLENPGNNPWNTYEYDEHP